MLDAYLYMGAALRPDLAMTVQRRIGPTTTKTENGKYETIWIGCGGIGMTKKLRKKTRAIYSSPIAYKRRRNLGLSVARTRSMEKAARM